MEVSKTSPWFWLLLTSSQLSIKILISWSPLGFHTERKFGKQWLCNVEIWIEETLTLLKVRRVVTEITLLLKYQKQTVAGVLMEKMPSCCCYRLSLEDRGYTKCCPLLLDWTFHRSNKITYHEFYWRAGHEFYYGLGIWNCKSWKLMLLRKSKSSLEKGIFSPKKFFQVNGNPLRKKKVYKMKEVRQNSTIKGYHEFHVRSH